MRLVQARKKVAYTVGETLRTWQPSLAVGSQDCICAVEGMKTHGAVKQGGWYTQRCVTVSVGVKKHDDLKNKV